MSDPQLYSTQAQRVPELQRALDAAMAQVDALYSRWQELQDKA